MCIISVVLLLEKKEAVVYLLLFFLIIFIVHSFVHCTETFAMHLRRLCYNNVYVRIAKGQTKEFIYIHFPFVIMEFLFSAFYVC